MITVQMSDAIKRMTITVKVTGLRSFQVRMWLGVKLIQLAAFIIGCNSNVVVETNNG